MSNQEESKQIMKEVNELAASMPEQLIIINFAEAIRKYMSSDMSEDETKLEECRRELVFLCELFMSKQIVGDDIKKAEDLTEGYKQHCKAVDFFNTDSN